MHLGAAPEPASLSVDCGASRGVGEGSRYARSEQALLKGLMADENTVARDVGGLGRVRVHFGGVRVDVTADSEAPTTSPWTLEEEPAHERYGNTALNLRALRRYLRAHVHGGPLAPRPCQQRLEQLLDGADASTKATPPFLRWEIIASWVQHLKSPPTEGPGSAPPKAFGAGAIYPRRRIGGGQEATKK